MPPWALARWKHGRERRSRVQRSVEALLLILTIIIKLRSWSHAMRGSAGESEVSDRLSVSDFQPLVAYLCVCVCVATTP